MEKEEPRWSLGIGQYFLSSSRACLMPFPTSKKKKEREGLNTLLFAFAGDTNI